MHFQTSRRTWDAQRLGGVIVVNGEQLDVFLDFETATLLVADPGNARDLFRNTVRGVSQAVLLDEDCDERQITSESDVVFYASGRRT
jgi:hypothetical protein